MRFAPTSAGDVAAIVREARARGSRLRLAGGDTLRATGAVAADAAVLDLSGLDRIIAYEPDELVLTVEAGVRLEAIVALLATRGQQLAFEPVLRGPASTIGGVIAANNAGPRRLTAGSVRDHFLGFNAVNGRGVAFRAGGRVVKNVTGFDLPKLLAGSWGSLAALTQVSLKVMPAPAVALTLALHGLDDARAVAALCAACGTAAEVSGAAHVPGLTLLRLEGFAPSVAARATLLDAALADFGTLRRMDDADGRLVWQALTDIDDAAASQWRLTVPPTVAAATVTALAAKHALTARYDWAGGLVLLSVAADGAAIAGDLHALAAAAGGSAMLLRDRAGAPPCPMFAPQPPALAALSARVRAAFDPDGVFHDRMVAR